MYCQTCTTILNSSLFLYLIITLSSYVQVEKTVNTLSGTNIVRSNSVLIRDVMPEQ